MNHSSSVRETKMSLSKYTPNSSSEIGYIEDIITFIFLRLPVKSVLKCKCVCKHWQSIASNPQFCRQHAALHGLNPSPSGLLFERSFDNSSDFEFCLLTGGNNNNTTRIASFDYLNALGNLSLLSSCNGLLLFQSVNSPDHLKFYVCNPTTKKFTSLALPNYLTTVRNVDANLAFDPRVSPHYKVIFLWRGLTYRYCIAIYSSEKKTCQKLIDAFASTGIVVVGRTGVFCNGKIHWLVNYGDTSLYFDIEKGCLNEFPLPPWYRLCEPIHCFGESRGHLHAILCGHEGAYVYELKEDYSGWVVKYRIRVPRGNLLLCYFREEQDEGSILLQSVRSREIVAYNLKKKTSNKVCDLNPLCNDCDRHYHKFNPLYEDYRWCSGAYQWIETLSCV